MAWAVTLRTTCMTCTLCVITMAPCREAITQRTVRTPSMGSGTALTTAMFIPFLMMMCANRLHTSCFIKDGPPFLLGQPTVLWEGRPAPHCVSTGLVG